MWQGFLDCRLKVKRASLDSISIREVPALVATFPEPEVIITQRGRHIQNMLATYHHCWDAMEMPICP